MKDKAKTLAAGTDTQGDQALRRELDALRQQIAAFQASQAECEQMRQALRRRAQELEALQATVLDMTASLALPDLLQVIVKRATRLLNGSGGGIYLCDAERGKVRCVVSHNTRRDYTGTELDYGEGAAGAVALSGQPLIIDDYRIWSGRAAVYEPDQPFTAVLCVPMLWQGQVIGVIIVLEDAARRHFTQADQELLSLFADHAAIAVHNARLYEQVQARTRFLETLQQINATLHSTLPLQDMLETIARGAGQALDYVGSLIVVPDARNERLTLGAMWGSRFVEAALRLTGLQVGAFSLPLAAQANPMACAYHSGQLQYQSQEPHKIVAGVEPAIPRQLAPLIARAMGANSVACVPLLGGGRAVGVLVVFSAREQLPAEERAMLLGLADQAGLAIHNAQLYQAARQELAERVRAEEELRQLKEFNEGIVQSMAEGITVEDAQGFFAFVNPAAAAMLGYTPQELMGQHWTTIVPPDQRPIVQAANQRRAQHEADQYELQLVHKDGRRLPVLLSGSPRFDDGRFAGTLAVFTDISERVEAEREMRRRNRGLTLLNQIITASATSVDTQFVLETACRELALAFDVPHACASLLDEQKTAACVVAEYLVEDRPSALGTTIPVAGNPYFQNLLSHKAPLVLSNGRPVGRGASDPRPGPNGPHRLGPIPELIHQRPPAAQLLLPLSIRGELVGSLELETGQPRPFTAEEVSLAWSVADQVAGALARARLDQQRQQLEDQYRQAQKMEAVGRLTAGIAHDFNNLLTAINGFTELIQFQLSPDDPLRNSLDKVLHSGWRAADLVRQLMAFSRRQLLKPQVLNLNTVVDEMDKLLQRIIGEHIEMKTVLAPDLWPVKVDPAQIEQVIANLAVNARDAMPGGGRLIIETANVTLDQEYAASHLEAQPGEHVLLAISDTGVGMSAEVKAHLFEPFFTTKGPGKGTGLGLATVYGIVRQSGGHIWVYSEEGLGTTFKIYLHRSQEAAEPVALQRDPADMPAGDETILLVEDEDSVRELAQRVLQSRGYSVLEARNGQEAAHLATDYPGPIHLLLTDMVMPGISGKMLADQLIQVRPGLKVVLMSGYTDQAITGRPGSGVETAFLQKPFGPAELSRKIRQALDTRR